MSFLFNRKGEVFETKKKRTVAVRNQDGSERPDAETIEHDGTEESMPESWVELAPSRASLTSSVEAVNVDDEGNSIFNSRASPISLQSPCVELESNLEQVKYRLAKDVVPKNTDWIWDWSSRPEAIPINSAGDVSSAQTIQQIASALTTPPNSPEPQAHLHSAGSTFDYSSPLRPRCLKKKQSYFSSFLRFEVFFGLVVSNIVTFVIGASIGFCICKKMHKCGSDSLIRMSSYHRHW